VTAVDNLAIFGNHSPTMFADFRNARINGAPADEVIGDEAWLKQEFLPTVGNRGAAIIKARGSSSAASAANALVDHVRSLVTPGDAVHSVAVRSDGNYGFAEGVWASVPVRTVAVGEYEVVEGFEHDAFAQEKLAATNAELVAERDTVSEMVA
jgi:malate dehydrogenase